MAIDAGRLLELSSSIAHSYNPALRVLGVASQSGDGDRAELLVRVAGCHDRDECLVMVNVARATEATLEAELPRALRAAFEQHHSDRSSEG
jgi:hypothetical protein